MHECRASGQQLNYMHTSAQSNKERGACCATPPNLFISYPVCTLKKLFYVFLFFFVVAAAPVSSNAQSCTVQYRYSLYCYVRLLVCMFNPNISH